MEWKRDWGLTTRVLLTGFLLFILYLVFMTVLVVFFPGVSIWLIVGLAVVIGLVQYFFSDKLVLWTTHSRIITDGEYPELHQTVEKLCHEADLPMPKIAIMQSPMPNAFATGRSPKHAVVCCTDSIMRLLTKDELEAGTRTRTLPCKKPGHSHDDYGQFRCNDRFDNYAEFLLFCALRGK